MKRKKTFFFLKEHWLFLLILFLAAFLRFYKIKELTTFGGDQGIDLLVVKRIILDHHWTLLGPKTSILSIYNGPIYYYMILPILFLSNLSPISVSYFMVLLWLGAMGVIYLLTLKMFNLKAALLASFFFSIWPISIEYSRVSFNSFPTPFFSALFLFGIWQYLKSRRLFWIIFCGLDTGLMVQLHYFNFLLILLAGIFLIIKRKVSFKEILIFLISFAIGFLPMIMFELKHQFFNSLTLMNSLRGGEMSGFNLKLHYFISFFPLAFIILGYLSESVLRKNKLVGAVLIGIIVVYFLSGINFGRKNGFTMPEGWNMVGVEKAGVIISTDSQVNFNVASIIDGDTRAYPFRYIIESNGKKPNGVEEYPQSSVLYVVGKGEAEKILVYPVWEIQSFLPAKVERIWEIQEGYKVYKLIKVEKI